MIAHTAHSSIFSYLLLEKMKFGIIFSSLILTTGWLLVVQPPMANAVDIIRMSEERLIETVQRCGLHMYDVMLMKQSLTAVDFSMVAIPDGSNHEDCPILSFSMKGVVHGDPALVATVLSVGELLYLGEQPLSEIYLASQSANGNDDANTVIKFLEHMYEHLGYVTNDAILNFIVDGPSAGRRLRGATEVLRGATEFLRSFASMDPERLMTILQHCGEQMYEVMMMKESMTSFQFSIVAIPDGSNPGNCPILDFDIEGVVESNLAAMVGVLTVGEFHHLGEHDLEKINRAFESANESDSNTVIQHLEHMYEHLGYETSDAIMNFLVEGPSPNRRLPGTGFIRRLLL